MRRNFASTGRASAAVAVAACGLASALVHAQGREWTPSGFGAQRTRWVRSDIRLTKSAIEEGEFRFLWKATFDNEARQLHSLTQPVLPALQANTCFPSSTPRNVALFSGRYDD